MAIERDERSVVRTGAGASLVLSDPAWLPRTYDTRSDTFDFFHVPRVAQQAATFLEPRFLTGAPLHGPVPVAAFAEDELRASAGPLHFIFHTSYCCSTVLARAMDVPGVAMGLKEPSVLMSFAEHWGSARKRAGALPALRAALDLLSRPLVEGEVHVIKPSNAFNPVIPYALFARPDAKAVLMTSSLEGFLTAIIRRGPSGRTMVREVLYAFAPTIPLENELTKEQMLLFDDLQAATLVWLMQIAFFDALARRFGPERVRILDGDTLISKPEATLAAVGGHFGLKPVDWASIAAGPTFREHAKNSALPFNASDHVRQRREAQSAYAAEMDAAIRWAGDVAARFGVPRTLRETIFG
ncbi:MAG: hypothetical protein U1E03_00160 [Hyphomonadaceae bacterium]